MGFTRTRRATARTGWRSCDPGVSGDLLMNSFLLALFASLLGAVPIAQAAGRSEVADAVMKGDRATLRALIQQKADLNAAQVDGATALHWAVYRDDLESADLLIAAGAKVDIA